MKVRHFLQHFRLSSKYSCATTQTAKIFNYFVIPSRFRNEVARLYTAPFPFLVIFIYRASSNSTISPSSSPLLDIDPLTSWKSGDSGIERDSPVLRLGEMPNGCLSNAAADDRATYYPVFHAICEIHQVQSGRSKSCVASIIGCHVSRVNYIAVYRTKTKRSSQWDPLQRCKIGATVRKVEQTWL